MSSYFYPYSYLNYNTLNRPPTFTNTCFPPNCPQPMPYIDRLKNANQQDYVNMLTERYNIGFKRLIDSREPNRFDNLNNYPIYNSNMGPLPSNYMNYRSKL
jgi:hypothetical protein